MQGLLERTDKYVEIVGPDIEKLAQEAHERGRPPVYAGNLLPSSINRLTYIELHSKYMMLERTRAKSNKVISSSTMRPHIQHGPAPPILSLRSTTIREVANKVNHIHNDCILFVRTIYDSHRMVGTNLLVERMTPVTAFSSRCTIQYHLMKIHWISSQKGPILHSWHHT